MNGSEVGMSQRILYRIMWVPSLLILAGMVVAFAMQPATFPTPDALTPYTTSDKSIAIEHPGNWKAHTLSMQGISSEVRFDPAPHVRFRVVADLAGSLLADIDRSTSN